MAPSPINPLSHEHETDFHTYLDNITQYYDQVTRIQKTGRQAIFLPEAPHTQQQSQHVPLLSEGPASLIGPFNALRVPSLSGRASSQRDDGHAIKDPDALSWSRDDLLKRLASSHGEAPPHAASPLPSEIPLVASEEIRERFLSPMQPRQGEDGSFPQGKPLLSSLFPSAEGATQKMPPWPRDEAAVSAPREHDAPHWPHSAPSPAASLGSSQPSPTLVSSPHAPPNIIVSMQDRRDKGAMDFATMPGGGTPLAPWSPSFAAPLAPMVSPSSTPSWPEGDPPSQRHGQEGVTPARSPAPYGLTAPLTTPIDAFPHPKSQESVPWPSLSPPSITGDDPGAALASVPQLTLPSVREITLSDDATMSDPLALGSPNVQQTGLWPPLQGDDLSSPPLGGQMDHEAPRRLPPPFLPVSLAEETSPSRMRSPQWEARDRPSPYSEPPALSGQERPRDPSRGLQRYHGDIDKTAFPSAHDLPPFGLSPSIAYEPTPPASSASDAERYGTPIYHHMQAQHTITIENYSGNDVSISMRQSSIQ